MYRSSVERHYICVLYLVLFNTKCENTHVHIRVHILSRISWLVKQKRTRHSSTMVHWTTFDCTITSLKGSENQRNGSFNYFVLKGNTQTKVCRMAFINIHAITQKRVFRITNLLTKGESLWNKRKGLNPNPKCYFLANMHIN